MTIDNFLNKYNSDYKKPTKYISFYSRSFCFFGHWFGRPTDITYEIYGAIYDSECEILEIILEGETKLTIKKPNIIIDNDSELIIENAEYILLEWIHFYDKTKNYLKISYENSKCFGESNLEHNFNDLDINKPALLWK
ncbi:hypothetical protein [uncultured Flavobacterium sp.]|uniref:hypothetical protein n=1 Tax=uncultured Flavobacterium sp. TaxID=165435 RepID=UPI0030EEE866|tara:strand:+ start:279220 stop:279633 length:414 start_codon:yes stop_codon:yes gene_type:complete